jgi:2'-5' RNA ligase
LSFPAEWDVTALRRAFLAVAPPPAVLRWTDSVADSARRDGDGLRWTRTEQRHLTVQFLGAVADLDPLVAAVGEAVRTIGPFTLALGGAGAFPSARRASVLWLGVREGADELTALAATIAGASAPLGFVADDRPYRPHLTLARSARTRDLSAVVEQVDGAGSSPEWIVDEAVLFDSDTRPDGAVHTVHARLPLGPPPAQGSGPSRARDTWT